MTPELVDGVPVYRIYRPAGPARAYPERQRVTGTGSGADQDA